MIQPFNELSTERIAFRKPSLQDAQEIFTSYAADPEVTKYLVWKPHRSIIDTQNFINSVLEKWDCENELHCIIEKKINHEIIGMIRANEHPEYCSIGYVIKKSEWHNGYATEALGLMLKFLFISNSISKVVTTCDIDNLPSAQVMKKNNMRYLGIKKAYVNHPNISNDLRDAHVYEITKEEYIKKHANCN